MPNWELEIKNAIYEESLEGEEKDNFLLIMNLLKGGTPQEYIADIDAKIKKAEQEKAVIESRINVAQEKIDFEFDAKVKEVNNAYVEEVAKISDNAPGLAKLMDSMARTKKNWNDMAKAGRAKGHDVKDFDETIDAIFNEVEPYSDFHSTQTYQNLRDFEQQMIDDYCFSHARYDKFQGKEEIIPFINQAKEKRVNALQALGEKPAVQSELLDKQKSLSDNLKNYEDNKKTIADFEKNQYKQMENVKIDGLSPAAKEKGTDLLLQARIDYQTKLNGFERLLANILPTWMYPNGKYVDRINSYKKSLKEVGFSDDEIKKAAPDKDATYLYNEETKKYDRLVRDDLDVFSEETVVKYDEPEKQEVRQQPKDLIEGLANETTFDKGNINTQKVEINNNVLGKNNPQIGGKDNQ